MLVGGDPQGVVAGVGIAVTFGDAVGQGHNVGRGGVQHRTGGGNGLEGPRARHTQRAEKLHQEKE